MRVRFPSGLATCTLLLLGLCAAILSTTGEAATEAPLSPSGGTTYYVSFTGGSDGNAGTSPDAAWQTVGRVNAASFAPGDTIRFARGDQWNQDLTVDSGGSAGAPITFSSYGTGPPPVLRRLTVDGDHTVFEEITIDHQRIETDAVRVRAQSVTLRGMTIRNGGRDGVDAADADGLLIESCHVHHFLAGSFTNQEDAHGVVATDIQGLTIRDTEIHHVSGDSFQADPSRSVNVPMDVRIEASHFWTGPLEHDFNAWNAGEVPGENAIDTKVADDSDWPNVERATFVIRDLIAHGWTNDGYISNRAVFNMKEKIEAEFDGVTVYDAEIGFRVRGTRGNANVTLKNVVLYDLEKGIRAEDDLQNLTVYNSTFGGGIDTWIQIAGGGGGTGTWDVRNNAFLGASPPAEAGHPSNRTATPSDFAESAAHDYHLHVPSSLQDAGIALAAVTADRDGVPRPQGAGHDVGAYEFRPALTLRGRPADETVYLDWTVDAAVPVTSTWEIVYDNASGDAGTVTGIPDTARAHTLTGLTNYTPYAVTLRAVLDFTPFLTDTVTVMPTDLFIHLPVVVRDP